MCHETTSVGQKRVIGSPVGTCVLSDFDHCDLILCFGQNTGTPSPRFLHPLKAAKDRGCRIVTFNPIREKGLVEFTDPQTPAQMPGAEVTRISDLYLQVRPGDDIAAIPRARGSGPPIAGGPGSPRHAGFRCSVGR